MATPAELFASAQEMADNMAATYGDTYLTGDYSYLENAKRQAFNLWDEPFPPGWGQPGETPEQTVANNAIEGLWLPLFVPAGADGYRGDGNPTGVFYATTQSTAVTGRLDTHGPAHESEDVDSVRFHESAAMGLNSATYTAGSPYVREA